MADLNRKLVDLFRFSDGLLLPTEAVGVSCMGYHRTRRGTTQEMDGLGTRANPLARLPGEQEIGGLKQEAVAPIFLDNDYTRGDLRLPGFIDSPQLPAECIRQHD